MGSAMSRCTNNRNSGCVHPGFNDLGQRILEKQPNWLVAPSRWRSRSNSNTHQPVRYRTPTPYPKDDRKPLVEEESTMIQEKATIAEKPVIKHVELLHHPRHGYGQVVQHPRSTKPTTKPSQASPEKKGMAHQVTTITWEVHPRLNRFERAPLT